jgi:hypothetical protein
MKNHLLGITIAVLWVLSGCATNARNPLAARRQAYKRLLSFIEPGMTRRQLYALLPPCRTPEAKPPAFWGTVGITQYTSHAEKHPLDRNFFLHVQYRLANLKEYPLPAFAPGRRHNPSINALLFGKVDSIGPFGSKYVASRENPDDELVCRPILIDTDFRHVVIDLGITDFNGLTVPKPSKDTSPFLEISK